MTHVVCLTLNRTNLFQVLGQLGLSTLCQFPKCQKKRQYLKKIFFYLTFFISCQHTLNYGFVIFLIHKF